MLGITKLAFKCVVQLLFKSEVQHAFKPSIQKTLIKNFKTRDHYSSKIILLQYIKTKYIMCQKKSKFSYTLKHESRSTQKIWGCKKMCNGPTNVKCLIFWFPTTTRKCNPYKYQQHLIMLFGWSIMKFEDVKKAVKRPKKGVKSLIQRNFQLKNNSNHSQSYQHQII